MNNESKETIKTVFDSFDKDKSNYIDIKEIGLVAKELGDAISEQDLQKVSLNKILPFLTFLTPHV